MAPTTPTPWPPAATSRPGPASAGHPAEALRLFRELLPDLERVLGPDHPDTLTTRNNIANWTGECGTSGGGAAAVPGAAARPGAGAGPRPPHTLITRSNIAAGFLLSEHPAQALRLFQELLADQERVLGRDHPSTLSTRMLINWLSTLDSSAESRQIILQLIRQMITPSDLPEK